MNYITLLEAMIARKAFRLHPALDPQKFILTDNMREAPDKWRAYAYSSVTYTNQKDSIKKGDMAEVGYVMISLADDTIVPISRADEHHKGYDHLYDLAKDAKKNGFELNPQNFIPIWSYGTNYIYSEKEIPELLVALRKYLSYGGRDGPLQGANDLRNLLVNSSQFVASNGNVNISPGKLAPVGEFIYDGFVAFAEVLREARNSHAPSATGRAFQAAIRFAAQLRQYIPYLGLSEEEYQILYKPEILANLKKEGDLRKLEELFFGFDGLKNNIHNGLRDYMKRQETGETEWSDDKKMALWGDIPLAVDKLGNI